MKIGIVGDTHGNISALRQVLSESEPVDYWLHTGDYSQDSRFISSETGLPVLSVAGNCDSGVGKSNIDEFITLEGKRIWLTHGHRYLQGCQVGELAWWAHRLEADVVVFGHTHEPLVKWYGELLVINPGSASLPRGNNSPSYAVLSLQKNEKPRAEIFWL